MSTTGVKDPVTKVVAGGRGGNRLAPGHPARARRPYKAERTLPPDPVTRDRMAKEHACRAIDQAADAGELNTQEVAVAHAVASFSGSTLEPVFPTLANIGRRAGGMAPRTVARWLASLRVKGWLVRSHRYIHYRDPHTRERKMRGTSCLWRLDVPARWLEPIRGAADKLRSAAVVSRQPGKGKPTPKAPQNQSRPRGRSPKEWDDEVAAAARRGDRLEKERLDRIARTDEEERVWARGSRGPRSGRELARVLRGPAP